VVWQGHGECSVRIVEWTVSGRYITVEYSIESDAMGDPIWVRATRPNVMDLSPHERTIITLADALAETISK
jgi:hypothetical protein